MTKSNSFDDLTQFQDFPAEIDRALKTFVLSTEDCAAIEDRIYYVSCRHIAEQLVDCAHPVVEVCSVY